MLFWLAYDNHVFRNATTLTASSTIGTFSADHLKDKRMYRQWRCNGVTGYVDVDFTTARDMDVLAFIGPRYVGPDNRDNLQWFITTDQVRHYLDNTTFGAGAIYDSGWVDCGVHPDRGYHVHLPDSRKTASKWRIQFNIASRTTAAYFDVSLLFAATIFQPAINYGFGDQLDMMDNSLLVTVPTTGGRLTSKYDRQLSFSAPFDWIPSATDRDLWIAFNDHVGTTEPFLMGLNDTAPLGRKVMLAVQQKTSPLSEQNYVYSSRDFAAVEHR